MTSRGRTAPLWAILVAALALALAPGIAQASWGKKADNGEHCSQGNGHHCYAIATWPMSGSEQVEGTLAYQYSTDVEVPGWASGDFTTHEEWAAFPSTGYWVEVGQIGGYGVSCCAMHPFWAYENSSGFTISESAGTVPFNTNELYMISGQNHNGQWCLYEGETQETCPAGFAAWNKDLEVGTEIGANTKPVSDGEEGTDGWWGKATHNWPWEERYVDGGLCAGRNIHAEAAGNIWFATCE
jgi:hypothetical protein